MTLTDLNTTTLEEPAYTLDSEFYDPDADPDAFDGEDREAVADEYGPKRSADVIPFRKPPKDRLPVPKTGRPFGHPPLASLYHTERAEAARQRAEEVLPEWLAEAQRVLIDAGLQRGNVMIADTADHNAMTLAYALRYAECGLHVADSYAIHPRTGAGMSMSGEAKVPLGAGWQNRASNDRDQIKTFWTGTGRYPENKAGKAWPYRRPSYPRNVSIVLPYGSGLFVLDEDGDDGMAAVAALEAQHGALPHTPDSRSGSGNGRHRIFRASRPIRNTASGVAPGVDIRGEGGQIIAAPSIHKTGNFYQWAEGCAPWECEIADAPEWLEDLAFAAMKANTAKVKRERRAARRSEHIATTFGSRSGGGFDWWCDQIGDGDGRMGFDGPIRDAALSWWRANPYGDEEEVFTILRDVIDNAPRDPAKSRDKYDTDHYLAGRIEKARVYIEDRRAAEEEADREEAEALETARAILRQHLVTADGKTDLAADAAQVAIARLTEGGIDPDDAADLVTEAAADVLRQIESRADDRTHDPVAEARREVAEAAVPSILTALYDERLVDGDGFMVRAKDAPHLYRAYKIKPTDDNAETRMRLEIRDQMFASLNARVSWVVLDGEAKWAIRGGDGEAVRLWKEQTIGKLFINRGVSYWEGEGDKAKVKMIKPADVITFARQRDTFLDTCFEPDPAKAAIAARRGQYNLWSGFAVQPRPGDWSKLRDHIRDQLCGGNMDHFNWVMTWLASIFARPGVKVPSSLAVIGEQGTGKSKVFDWLRRGIGCAALKVSAARHLTGNFNAHLDGKVLLICEEAFWGGDTQSAGVLKDLITSETLQIEGKFANLVERPNYVAVVFISNNSWVVPTDGEDARRFLVLHCLDTRKQDAGFFGAIDDQMENGGLEAMVHELTHWQPEAVDLSWTSLRNPPVTDGLRQQAGMGLRGPLARLVSILENGVLSGREADGSVFYYALSDDQPTPILRHHMVAALNHTPERGNMTGETKAAIDAILGTDADGGDNKKVVPYFGDTRRLSDDETSAMMKDDGADPTLLRVVMKGKGRVVTIPALSSLAPILARYGRG
ncbi:MAG: bifunctional DNA primase/polymerase [Pseudomonadota bacterium]